MVKVIINKVVDEDHNHEEFFKRMNKLDYAYFLGKTVSENMTQYAYMVNGAGMQYRLYPYSQGELRLKVTLYGEDKFVDEAERIIDALL